MHLWKFFAALGFLPLITALGYDISLYYNDMENGFRLSALGFVLTNSFPDLFRFIVEESPPEIWAFVNTHIMTQKTVFLGLGLGISVFFIALFLHFFLGAIKGKDLEEKGKYGEKVFSYKRK